MREITAVQIADAVARLCVEANTDAGADITTALERALKIETDGMPRRVLEALLENAKIAKEEHIPICQDTGMAVVFAELGQDIHITGGALDDAINDGVRRGTREGYLRSSVVRDPVRRDNTLDNTPAVVHLSLVPGSGLRLIVAPKGFGSENMSAVKMLKPADGLEGLERFVLETVQTAGGNPCPPVIVGVGAGGTFELAALLSKKALLREVGTENPDPFWDEAEKRLLAAINELGIGPGGFGGKTTALAVHINPYATHIAGLPVAVNIGCHVTRHKETTLPPPDAGKRDGDVTL
ncbi:MAG: fumarate hydratase [Oscillospiraceae bacterium]|jgi:fumarate hydratase subunit alpha|nr:fumarate hydratase [Oscillospiraceae bacterium]